MHTSPSKIWRLLVEEYSFLINFQADLDLRLGLFAFAVHVGGYVVPTGVAHRAYTAVAEIINDDDDDGMEFAQGLAWWFIYIYYIYMCICNIRIYINMCVCVSYVFFYVLHFHMLQATGVWKMCQ